MSTTHPRTSGPGPAKTIEVAAVTIADTDGGPCVRYEFRIEARGRARHFIHSTCLAAHSTKVCPYCDGPLPWAYGIIVDSDTVTDAISAELTHRRLLGDTSDRLLSYLPYLPFD